MKTKALPLLLALAFAAGGAWASPQTERMKSCNADPKAKELKGDERKAFMSDCLKGKTAAAAASEPAGTAQQNRMKTCNADPKAKELKGDERKKFMSECLKSK